MRQNQQSLKTNYQFSLTRDLCLTTSRLTKYLKKYGKEQGSRIA